MKTTIKLLMALIFIITITNCTKIKERKKTVINISVLNPITKEGSLYSGIRYELVKQINKIDKSYPFPYTKDDIICKGTTDSEGKATIEFFREMNHNKVNYTLYGFWDSAYGFLGSVGTFNVYGSKTYIADVAQDKINNAVFYMGEIVSFPLHIKNTNCFDANDRVSYNVERGIYLGNYYGENNTFVFDSCYDDTFYQTLVEDYYPYTKTVTRNGVTTVTKDTLKIEQGMDTLKWYY